MAIESISSIEHQSYYTWLINFLLNCMARKVAISPRYIESLDNTIKPKIVERYRWKYRVRGDYILLHDSEQIATIKRHSKGYKGTLGDRLFEIEVANPEVFNHRNLQREPHPTVIYSIRKELNQGEWEMGFSKVEWGRLEYVSCYEGVGKGPYYINIPAKINVNHFGEYSIGEKIVGKVLDSAIREYSIIDRTNKDRFRILAMTKMSPRVGGPAFFDRYDVEPGDPDSSIFALASFVFARSVYYRIDDQGD